MRWGKPRKNFKHRDPRYFLFEQQENSLENLTSDKIKSAFEQAGELFLKEPFKILHTKNMPAEKIQEQEEDTNDKIQAIKPSEEVLQMAKDFVINFIRRKILMKTSSFFIRLLVRFKIGALFGPGTVWFISKIASQVHKDFDAYKTIMDQLKEDSLDKALQVAMKKFLPKLEKMLYPKKDPTLIQIAMKAFNEFLSYATMEITNLLKGPLEAAENKIISMFFGGNKEKYMVAGKEVENYFNKLTPEQKEKLLEDPTGGQITGLEKTKLYKAITSPTGEMPAVNQPSSPEKKRTQTVEIPSLRRKK